MRKAVTAPWIVLFVVLCGISTDPASASPITIVSRTVGGAEAGGGLAPSRNPISSDGRYVVFSSYATNVVPGQVDSNAGPDLFLYDRLTRTSVLVSRSLTSPTTTADGATVPTGVEISADGRYVVFDSFATDLVAGQPLPNFGDLFVFDRVSGTVQWVGRKEEFCCGFQFDPDINADGRYIGAVAYGDNVAYREIDLIDRTAATTTRITHGNGARSSEPRLSADGRYLTFTSHVPTLVPGQIDTNSASDVFLYDRVTGTIELVSRTGASPITTGNADSYTPALSADGRFVVYSSFATDLVPGLDDENLREDLFLFDRVAGTTTLVSRSIGSATTTGNNSSREPRISADGRYVAFQSVAVDLVEGQTDTNEADDIFLFDRVTGAVTLVSRSAASATTAGNNGSQDPRISADGRFIAFHSAATDLISGGTNLFFGQVYLFDRVAGTTTLVSRDDSSATTGLAGSSSISNGQISADGGHVVFENSPPALLFMPNVLLFTRFAVEASTPASSTIAEPAGSTSFTITLSTLPSAAVTIGLSSSDAGECVPGAASAVLDGTNWSTGVTVTIQAVDDAVDDGAQPCTIVTAPAASTDLDFAGLDPADVAVQVADNDAAGVDVVPIVDLATTEAGGTADFTVVLTSQPMADVTIGLTSSDTTEGTVPASVTFTAADWSVPRTVTVTGQDDALVDGSVAYTVQTSITSADPVYAALDPPDIALVNHDDDSDRDGDVVVDAVDNCPATPNPDQADLDGDGGGDACDVDDDADGVADEVEQAAPNGGDGNFDGTPDHRQPEVASLRSSTDKTFLTLVAAGCPGFFDVLALSESAVGDSDPGWDFPYGLVLFRLPCLSAEVTLWLHTAPAMPGAVYRQHPLPGRPGGWSAPSAVFAISSGVLTLTLSLADGAGGDPVEPGALIEALGGLAGLPLASCPSSPATAPGAFERAAGSLRSRRGAAASPAGPWIVGSHRVTVLQEDPSGLTIEYEVTLENLGPAPQPDNPGPELITFLPLCATVVPGSATATSGTVDVAADQVIWNGNLGPAPAAASALRAQENRSNTATVEVTVKVPNIPIQRIAARALPAAASEGRVTWWQSTILSDADLSGDNETLSLTDDPGLPGQVDPTPVASVHNSVAEIPTVSELGLLALALLLAAAALRLLRRRGAVALLALLALLAFLLPARGALAQKKITCPNGEVRLEVDVKQLALKYEGWSMSGTLSSLSVLGARLGVDQKTVQQAAAATQQWNELIKGLAAGYNSCALTREQFAHGLERIYPRLKEDAADLEKIRQLLVQGQQAEEKRLKTLLDSYAANLRRFAEIGGQDVLLDRIEAVVEREVAEGTGRLAEGQEKILQELAALKRRLEETPLASPEAAKTAVSARLEAKARAAEEAYQAGYDLLQRFRFQEAAPHFERALAAVKLHEFYVGLGETLQLLNETERAESVFREGLALAREERDEPHEAELSFGLGQVLLSRGDLDGALASTRRALEISEKVLGTDQPEVARISATVGQILQARGDLDGALEATRRALRLTESALGAEHQDVALLASTLGVILHARGDLDGALQSTRRALRIFDASLGPEQLHSAQALSNIGAILYARGDLEGALESSRRALEIDEKIFGPDHPRAAMRATNLGMILLRLGDLDGALQQSRRALQIDERTYGSDHPNVAIHAGNLGQILVERGDLEAALRASERALRIDEKTYGPDHPQVALRSGILATVLRERGDLTAALAAVQRALRIDEATFGPDHPNVAWDSHALATVLRDQGDLDGALQAARRALSIDELTFGPDHPSVARDSDVLASVLLDRGDVEGALKHSRRALQIGEKTLGPGRPAVAQYARGVALVLQRKGDLEGALSHFERALRILGKTYGSDHPATRKVAGELESLNRQVKKAAAR